MVEISNQKTRRHEPLNQNMRRNKGMRKGGGGEWGAVLKTD